MRIVGGQPVDAGVARQPQFGERMAALAMELGAAQAVLASAHGDGGAEQGGERDGREEMRGEEEGDDGDDGEEDGIGGEWGVGGGGGAEEVLRALEEATGMMMVGSNIESLVSGLGRGWGVKRWCTRQKRPLSVYTITG